MAPLVFDADVETIVGNGRLIARVRAATAEFVFAGPSSGYRLLADDGPADVGAVRTLVAPGWTRYEVEGRGAVTVAAQPDAALLVVLVEATSEAEWALELTGPVDDAEDHEVDLQNGEALLWTPEPHAHAVTVGDAATGTLRVRLAAGDRAAFLLGDEGAAEAVADPFEAVEAWAAQTAGRGIRLRTPVPELDRAVEFAKAHLLLGYDWVPDEDGRPGGEGSKLVCDVFRWRDVWSRDFGSGFGPGGIAAGLMEAVLATLDYEASRYSAHDPAGLKISDDTSQGGSAEALGWVLTLVWRVYGHTGGRTWLRTMVEAFEPWVEEWIARDADEDGLVVDVTEWMDHSRFLRLVEGQRTLYSNVLYSAALLRMAWICEHLDRAEDAARYRALAEHSRQSIHDAFWNEAGYFNNAVQWGVPDTVLMLADNAIAVVEEVAGPAERARTLETIRERSWRRFGSVTTDVPMRYVPADNDHNERVWPWWMAHEAKARFLNGDAGGGLHVLGQIVDTFARPTLPGLCEEYLDPDDGTQDDVVGHAFITGSGALLDAVQHGLVGLSVRQPGERDLRLAPAVPRSWEAWGADLDLVAGRLSYDQTAEGVRVVLENTNIEALELGVPPRESIGRVTVDGAEVEPGREEEAPDAVLRLPLPPGGRHVVEVAFAPRRARSSAMAIPPLPPPVSVERALLMGEPKLSSDVLQGAARAAESALGPMRPVAAGEVADLEGAGDLLVVVGNEMPYRTRGGEPVTDLMEGFLGRGGSLLLLGPRFPPIDLTAYFHGGAQMGGHAGLFWWKVWADGRWQDYDARDGEVLDHPEPEGTVYWGDGPLFAAWEHGLGLFGFGAECRGVFDVEAGVMDPDLRVETVYTDWTVRKPWTFTPLAFTERDHPLVTGPRRERYPCAALVKNEATGGRIVVVAPSVCSRPDLLGRTLAHVAVPAETAE